LLAYLLTQQLTEMPVLLLFAELVYDSDAGG